MAHLCFNLDIDRDAAGWLLYEVETNITSDFAVSTIGSANILRPDEKLSSGDATFDDAFNFAVLGLPEAHEPSGKSSREAMVRSIPHKNWLEPVLRKADCLARSRFCVLALLM